MVTVLGEHGKHAYNLMYEYNVQITESIFSKYFHISIKYLYISLEFITSHIFQVYTTPRANKFFSWFWHRYFVSILGWLVHYIAVTYPVRFITYQREYQIHDIPWHHMIFRVTLYHIIFSVYLEYTDFFILH